MLTMSPSGSAIAGFHSVTLSTPDTANSHRAYRQLFGDAGETESCSGAVALVEGPSDAALGVNFRVDALAPAARLLQRRGIDLAIEGDRAAATVHGVEIGIVAGAASALPADDLTGIDHVVYVSANADRAAAILGARLGLDLRLDRTHFEGLPQMFFRCGVGFLEVLIAGDDAAADDHLWGIAWRSNNIERSHARLTAAGIEVSEVRVGRKPGTRVFTVKDTNLVVPTLVIEPTPKP